MQIEGISGIKPVRLAEAVQEKTKTGESFAGYLKDAMAQVNNIQKEADQLSLDFALGKIDSVHDVVIAAEKAHLTMDLVLAIHRKVLDAYKELMRLQF